MENSDFLKQNKMAWFLLTYVYFLPERTKWPEPLGWFSSTVKNLWSVKTFPWKISLSAPSEHLYVHHAFFLPDAILGSCYPLLPRSFFWLDFYERLYEGLPKELGEIFSVPVLQWRGETIYLIFCLQLPFLVLSPGWRWIERAALVSSLGWRFLYPLCLDWW